MQIKQVIAACLITMAGVVVSAQMGTKMVGGAEMFPAKNIVENAVNSKDCLLYTSDAADEL